MTDSLPTETESDPCEKCGAPVFGYVEQRCCDGRECGCMGRPLEPCWCAKCWDDYTADAKRRRSTTLAAMLEDLEHEEDPRE